MKPRVALLATLIWLRAGLVPAEPGRPKEGPPVGAEWQPWQELIAKHFAHGRIVFATAPRPLLGGGRDGCATGPFQRPGLLARVRSREPKVFGDVELAVFKLTDGADGYQYLRGALDRHTRSSTTVTAVVEGCAFVGNTAVAAAQVGGYWVEVTGHCQDGALYRYEVSDVLAMLREKDPSTSPTTFAISECGRGTPQFLPVAEFLGSLEKKASYWGREFPAARDRARARVLDRDATSSGPTRR